MTRAPQVVAWWSPAWAEPNGGLSRLLRGRAPGESTVPDRCAPVKISDGDAMARLQKWEAAEALVIEESVVAAPAQGSWSCRAPQVRRPALPPRDRHRVATHVVLGLDTSRRDERRQASRKSSNWTTRSPTFPSSQGYPGPTCRRRWRICRRARSSARWCTRCWKPRTVRDRSAAELETQIREHSVWWPVDVDPSELAAAMVPMHDTPLGPLAAGAALRQIGLPDRLRELDFELRWRAAIYRWQHRTFELPMRRCCCASTFPPTMCWRAMPTG